MEEPNNVFRNEDQLFLSPEDPELLRSVQSFVVNDDKFWLAFDEKLSEEQYLTVHESVVALVKRSRINYLW